MKILTVVGARPQFIKAAMVSRAIIVHNQECPDSRITEEIIHTGQHYDANMSDVFFKEMKIPVPAVQLNCGAQSHGAMTGQMLEAVEREILNGKPDWVLVYGDTNSTLAGALAAVKLHVPVAHVEAGLRSYNKKMPEEINRILTDHVSSALFCPTTTAVENLAREGLTDGVCHVGDIMYDAALFFSDIAERTSSMLDALALESKSYYLATVHRQENTDDRERLIAIVEAFNEIATRDRPVVMPLHPRTRIALLNNALAWPSDAMRQADADQPSVRTRNGHVHLIPPVSFLDMVVLEKNARIILTDSGGVQKEAYWHQVPCVTLRGETEWVETVDLGWNYVVDASALSIVRTVNRIDSRWEPSWQVAAFGEGNAADLICKVLLQESLSSRQCDKSL